jgi:NADH-quinone oxidoreductase subunit E
VFTAELRREAEALVARYPVSRSALLPLLHLVQSQDGYISRDGVAECAELLGLTKAEVGAVATFYTMYKREPLGRHLVSVCTNFSCKVRGAQEVYDNLSKRLGVGHNETTADGAITLEHAECLGNCEGAPIVSVDYLNYECLTPEQALELVDRLIAGEVPPPTRGYPSPGIREVSHRLAGLGPVQPEDRVSVVCTASEERPSLQRTGRAEPTEGALHDGTDKAAGPTEGAFTQAAEERKAEAERRVAEAGMEPESVESQSGYSAREFPTTDTDEDAATTYADSDPRKGSHRPTDRAEERERPEGGTTDG